MFNDKLFIFLNVQFLTLAVVYMLIYMYKNKISKFVKNLFFLFIIWAMAFLPVNYLFILKVNILYYLTNVYYFTIIFFFIIFNFFVIILYYYFFINVKLNVNLYFLYKYYYLDLCFLIIIFVYFLI